MKGRGNPSLGAVLARLMRRDVHDTEPRVFGRGTVGAGTSRRHGSIPARIILDMTGLLASAAGLPPTP